MTLDELDLSDLEQVETFLHRAEQWAIDEYFWAEGRDDLNDTTAISELHYQWHILSAAKDYVNSCKHNQSQLQSVYVSKLQRCVADLEKF